MARFLDRLKYLFTGRLPRAETRRHQPMSRVDAAQTSDENRKHWANADSFSANVAYDPGTRQILRNRSRYETLNNSYLKGLVKASTYDLVGTGPRPSLSIPGDDDGMLARRVEFLFSQWAKANCFGKKCRLLQRSKVRDGEAFAIYDTWDESPDPVKFALKLVEADQCTTPNPLWADPFITDGVQFDHLGNPVNYFFLRFHPGDLSPVSLRPLDYETIPASRVIHWYDQDRIGQQRGIPDTTSALPLFSQLRRYSLATLTAAEFAAMIAGIMKTNLPPGDATADPITIDRWELIEMVRGALLTLPGGYDATQFKAEQPTTSFPDFERAKLNEAGRSIGAPLNVTTGNSSLYNFSSGRLDHLPYQRNHWIDRTDFDEAVTDRCFWGWHAEAAMIRGYLPSGLPDPMEWTLGWTWDGFDEIDQLKSAQSDDIRLRNGTYTLESLLAERSGEKWRDVIDQLAKEIAYCKSKGVRHPFEAVPQPTKPTDPSTSEDGNTPKNFSRNGRH